MLVVYLILRSTFTILYALYLWFVPAPLYCILLYVVNNNATALLLVHQCGIILLFLSCIYKLA